MFKGIKKKLVIVQILCFLTLSLLHTHTITKSVYTLEQPLETTLFPVIKPNYERYLAVSDLHTLWYAEYGNSSGIPVVFFHGGPGFGTDAISMRYFDPIFYRIILIDQRGSGRSTPTGELQENTTEHLIRDMETIRTILGIEKWLIFGGSWGSALALLYAQKNPDRCLGLILRGIFLAREKEYHHLWYTMKHTHPEAAEALENFLPESERSNLIAAYYKKLIDKDPVLVMEAATAFMKYDLTAAFLMNNPEKIATALTNTTLTLGCARIFTHYCMNNFFISKNEILDNINKIIHIPTIIVQGRYDVICLPSVAYELHKNLPLSELIFVQDAGHSASEPGIVKALVEATEYMKKIIV